ncbi:MAG TPA: agmatine deiminase family protein [Terriglobia bacterium]|nr:agmatine deiminase family protein [Terriglobia bacterium]
MTKPISVTKRLTPAAVGYRMPAEWEPHAATWIAWPHNRRDWPGKFLPIPWVFGEIVRKLALSETVNILVASKTAEPGAIRLLKAVGADLAAIKFYRIPTDRVWTRDYGPVFLKRRPGANLKQPELAIVRFRFNGWAKYPDCKRDDHVSEAVAKALNCVLVKARAGDRDFVLEGGSIDVNGEGAVMTTEECLLDSKVQTRNPGLSRPEIEAALGTNLGVDQVIWLGRGIAGDDTHGHVDDFCRFVSPRTVVLCQEAVPHDSNYRPLQENRERLMQVRLKGGSQLEIVALPMPRPLYFKGQRLPASYANFYIANNVILVPTFNDPKDRAALGILADLFPGRSVIGIHAVDLVWGLGTLHCLTQQQPAGALARPDAFG